MTELHQRYILDPLYGRVRLPEFVWTLLSTPEIQRLREVRMCNVNSLCLTGGANINRFEHAIGTAYLALVCLDEWPLLISPQEKKEIVGAALIHDINSAAFGHTVEYVLGPLGFDHAEVESAVTDPGRGGAFTYRHAKLQEVYFGQPPGLPKLLTEEQLQRIGAMVRGQGPHGALISGSMDLDNIDNVFRLAYHIGLVNNGRAAQVLARSMWVEDERLRIHSDALESLSEWQRVRKALYEYLLLNPEEFSAKCMLEEALWLAHQEGTLEIHWSDVDFQLLERLSRGHADIAEISRRIATGDLYGCIGILASERTEIFEGLRRGPALAKLEAQLSSHLRVRAPTLFKGAMVRLHAIKDCNKTRRQVRFVDERRRERVIGTSSRRLLIGIFVKNRSLSFNRLPRARCEALAAAPMLKEVLQECLGIADLLEMRLYGEGMNNGQKS